MTLKALIFLIIVWNLSIFASANNIYHLRFFLGCRAVIPCQHKSSDSNSFKWFYKKNEHSENIRIFSEDKSGLQHRSHRGSVTRDRAFVISTFTDDDQGLYWCERCYNDKCKSEQLMTVTKEIMSESHETVYLTAGSSFTYSCPGEFTNFEWTYDASYTTALGNSAVRPETDKVTFNRSIHIGIVKRANAGKYTFWANKCNGPRQKICTVNVCVITVHQTGKSSVSCDVMCKVEFNYTRADSISINVTDTQTVSVHVNPHGPLNCSAKQMYDSYTTINAHAPSNASVKTTDAHTQHQYLVAVIYGTTAAITSLILLALFIFYFRPRLRAAFSDHPSGSDINGMVEEESSVVYSSVGFRTPAMTANSDFNHSDCVYSEIRV